MDTLAPDSEIGAVTAAIGGDADSAAAVLAALLASYPEDPRLHFLNGSVLASSGQPIEAHRALARAVELAPGYALARYQLGFFELTSGEPAQALSTWGPLLAGGEDSYLRKFVEGMTHLIRDEFAEAIARFEQGIALNRDNAPMNADIRLLIAECRRLQAGTAAPEPAEPAEHSATSLILGRFGGPQTLQ